VVCWPKSKSFEKWPLPTAKAIGLGPISIFQITCINPANDMPAYFMIDTPHKPFLPAREPFQVLFRRLGAF
jgi:hypothetical protein